MSVLNKYTSRYPLGAVWISKPGHIWSLYVVNVKPLCKVGAQHSICDWKVTWLKIPVCDSSVQKPLTNHESVSWTKYFQLEKSILKQFGKYDFGKLTNGQSKRLRTRRLKVDF